MMNLSNSNIYGVQKGEKKEEGETFSTSMPIATKSIDVIVASLSNAPG